MLTWNDRDPLNVTVEIDGEELLVGTLRVYSRRGQKSMTFQYASSYLSDPRAYQIDPAIPLDLGISSPAVNQEIFGVFADGAPDRWGQNLMRREEQNRAKAEGKTARTLTASDFLLGTRDVLRQGAVRLRIPGTDVHIATDEEGVPALIQLGHLLNAADAWIDGESTEQEIKDLLNAGGSLGGARPKAAVILQDGSLGIAKFPDKDKDNWDVCLWEKVEQDLALRSGIDVTEGQLLKVADRNVLVVKRFDRDGQRRIGFASAMTLLEAKDGDHGSYVDLASVIEINSNAVERDLEELFRRIIFSILTNNTDDHLRNHAFLRRKNAWSLSPAFDLNPNPHSSEQRTMFLDSDGLDVTIESMISVAEIFRLSNDRAREILSEVETATGEWRKVAVGRGAKRVDIDLMDGAFESEERKVARSLTSKQKSTSKSTKLEASMPAGFASPSRQCIGETKKGVRCINMLAPGTDRCEAGHYSPAPRSTPSPKNRELQADGVLPTIDDIVEGGSFGGS